MTTSAAQRTHSVNEVWKVVREQGADIASLKQIASSTSAEVRHLGEAVGRVGSRLDEVLQAVTSTNARQGPGLMQIMSGLGLLLAIVGGLSTGIAVFVGSMYGGQLASLERDLTAARTVIAAQQEAERAELVKLREDRFLALGARLDSLEANAGWAPSHVMKAPTQ